MINGFYDWVEKLISIYNIILCRHRTIWLSLRGVTIAAKVNVGSRVKLANPLGVKLGRRTTIEHDVYLKLVDKNAKLNIGESVFMGNRVCIDCIDRIDIGSNTLLAPGCFVTDHNHGIDSTERINRQECIAQPVKIGDDVWIGANAVILPGVTIGDGAVVGAGAVVVKDVVPYSVVGGVPAKKISNR